MADSTCVRCGETAFEVVENTPHGSQARLLFVQCRKCGGVVGIQELYNISHLIIEQNKALEAIGHATGALLPHLSK
jgi:ribosomal protein L37E